MKFQTAAFFSAEDSVSVLTFPHRLKQIGFLQKVSAEAPFVFIVKFNHKDL